MKVKGLMYGKRIETIEELEDLQKWLILRGLMASINKEKMYIEIKATLHGNWVEDAEGDLVCLKD